MKAPLVISVLGPLHVQRGEAVLAIGAPMQRRLLTALVIAQGDTVSVDRLVEALWGTDPPRSARNGLQTYVARLRDALGGPDPVVTRPPGYALDATEVAVDAWRFHDSVRHARHTVASDPLAAAAELERGLAAWRGEAYGEFADEALGRDASAQLDDLRAEAVELLAEARLRQADASEALAVLDAAGAGSELRESTVLLRGRALAAAGRLPDALGAVRAYRERLAEELGLDASPMVDDLEQRLLRGEVSRLVPGSSLTPADRRRAPVAAPRIATETVGRAADRERVLAAMGVAPLVTLVGPGGVGKSRVAMLIGGEDAGGAWIDLAPVRRAEDVVPAFAEGLGISVPRGSAPGQTVTEALSAFPGIVVVDNCEQVLDAVAQVLDVALARSGRVRVLATSRERLDVAGELVVPIAPLRAPPPGEAAADDPAIQLFLDRLAAAGGPVVEPSAAARVVAAVDGLPLAIELAAARAASLPIEDLVARLHGRLDVLAGTRRRHGDRHQTLERVITWSHDLLDPASRLLFRRLSVFTATFQLEDAERICADEQLPPEAVAAELARLVDASMVTRREDGRFRLLEPLRLYAAAELSESADEQRVHERQRQAALELTAYADAAVSGPDETAAVREVELGLPDLRAVHARALERADLGTVARMAAQLYRFAYLQARTDVLGWGASLAAEVGPDIPTDDRARALAAAATGCWLAGALQPATELVAAAARLARDPWSRATVAEAAGDVHLALGDLDAAIAWYRENVECAQAHGHVGLTAQAEVGQAFARFQRGDREGIEALVRAGRRRAEASGAPSVRALAEYILGEVLSEGDPDGALVAFERARSLAMLGRARFQEGLARTADVALRGRHGPPDEALRRYREALTVWRDCGAEGLLLTTLRNLVVLLARIGADEAALEIHRVTERLATRTSYGDEARRLDAAVAAARERLGPDRPTDVDAGLSITDLRGAADLALASIDAVATGRRPAGGTS